MSPEMLCLRSLIFKSSHSLLSFCSQFSETPFPLGEFKLVPLLLKVIDKPYGNIYILNMYKLNPCVEKHLVGIRGCFIIDR